MMRKLFTFLCAALMSVGMCATTVVTITNSDFPMSGQSFTKDGVTVSAGMIDSDEGNLMAGGSFSTTLGNFTQIEVNAMDVNISGEGWSGNSQKKTWTGNASSVSFSGEIMGMGMGTTLKFTIAEPAPEPDPAKYYIVGSMNSWGVDENYEMNPSLEAETEEYFYTLDLTTTSEFKVVKVQNGQQSWIPEGMGNNYGQNGEITEDGEYTVYFRPNYDGGEDWFYSCIYAEKTGEFVPETPTYYLVGNMTGWGVDENYELNPNIDSDIEEYFYVLDLTTTSQFKVVKVQNGQQSWFPSGMDNNYGQNGEITEDGEYTIYFRPNYNGGDDWFYNCIYVSKNEPQSQETVVTITEADYVSGNTITKDGVTLTANQIYGVGSWYVEGPGTFTNTIGNFTKIEVTTVGGSVFIEGDGWTGDWDKMTWTGNAPTVSFTEDIFGKGEGFSIVCTIAASEPQPTGKQIVVFEANGNRKEVEVELPHTFWCDLLSENGELDLIIQELYALPQGGYCDYYYDGPVATGNPAVTAGADDDANHFITVSGVFEGTATVSGKYNKYTEMDEEDFTYTLTISIKDTPTAVVNVQTNQVQATKILRDGMLLIEKNGKLFNVTGALVR